MPSLGTRRSTILKKRSLSGSERAILFLKRFGLALGLIVLIAWLGAWWVLSGSAHSMATALENKAILKTASWGFRVQNVMVDGRNHTDPDTLKAMMGVEKGAPIFAFDPVAMKQTLEKIQWVKSADVERRLPDTLYVRLTEREPYALWQKNKRLVLIDREGAVLTDQAIEKYKNFVIVTGEGAPQMAEGLLSQLDAEPLVRERVDAAILMGGRRWDLKLKSGALVKLPEQDVGLALRRLAANHEEEALLDKDVLVIDVREGDRITVRTKPGAAQDFNTGGASSQGNPI